MSIVPDDPEEHERERLHFEGARHYKHVPDLAYRWLEELLEEGGLPDISAVRISHKEKPLRQSIQEDPVNTPSDPSTYPARLDNGQVIWVKLDEGRSSAGHRSVSLVDKPNTVRAILAALTVLECRQTDTAILRSVLPFLEPSHPVSIHESQLEAFRKLVDEGNTEAASSLLKSISGENFNYRSLEYAVALLRYFRPDFDSLPIREQRALLEECCERTNKLLEASRHLNEFLEYGRPDRDQRPALENPHRDVQAAALRDIEGHTYREIAKILDVKISEKARHIGDYSTVTRMVSRGRKVLERALGEDGWRQKAAAMKSRLKSHRSLRPHEQFIADCAVDWGVSFELASKIIVEELDPEPEQIESMVRRSGVNVESARRLYEKIYRRSPPAHVRLVRSEDLGWWDIIPADAT